MNKNNFRSRMSPFSFEQGVGLIEVLVALLVMSIGVLGYAGMQLQALNSTSETHYRTQATAIANDVVERIGANGDSLAWYSQAGNWDQDAMTRTKPSGWDACIGQACTSAEIAAWDVLQARWTAWTLLPNGHVAAATCAASELVCVTVAWNDASPLNCDPAEDDCVQLEVVQ